MGPFNQYMVRKLRRCLYGDRTQMGCDLRGSLLVPRAPATVSLTDSVTVMLPIVISTPIEMLSICLGPLRWTIEEM